ncbi:hypothetical protein G3R58_002931 [Salmonella enterica]|nr:hypothetical protein [Salmonella enterica subsp. enterica serovar Schwarzengrund]ECH1566740.1 hypothetical protein [Salmonella enterica subsp. enterica serovar Schwarzengrund]EEG2405430.1 hypothetical protein [Salmonella enterica subsp. enterica serovar Schwarzengrund]EEG6703641.1 hypothetical protein [Salmonella enterica subsp. enterica serovar Schwarzengrund]EEL3959026.1 hypothetical protein [Salmonella enterica subsp. enterica serovar Schwarzengrund]
MKIIALVNTHLCLYLQKVTDLLAGIVLTNVKEIKAIDFFTTGISMVNDKDTAVLISELMLRFGKELDESVAVVQSRCDEDEFKVYREAVGLIMGEMLIKIMNPLYEKTSRNKTKRIEIKHLEPEE